MLQNSDSEKTIYDRPMLKPGDHCFFIRTSDDEPYLLYRFGGTIWGVDFLGDIIIYHIVVTNIFETLPFLKKNMNGKIFRGTTINSAVRRNVKLYPHPHESIQDFVLDLSEKFVFEAPCTMVYETKDEMLTYFDKARDYIKSVLITSFKELETKR